MPRLALFLLGPPRIERDGEPVEIRRRKAVALLVYLAVTGQSHSRDALATLFWPELDQGRARAGLRRALTALRQGVGESFLDVDRETVGLNRDVGIWLDVAEFEERLAECRTHDHPEDEVCPACLSLLAEATALYRDDFLTGFTLPDCPAFDEWQFFQGEGLRTELANALERLAVIHGSRSEFDQAIAYARRWLALDPLQEPAHRCLMRLYAWSGQRAAALRQYGECERVLREELSVSPEEETIRVYEAIEENRELPVPAAPVSAQPIGRKHNLLVQLIPFVGREAMLTGIADRLRDPDCRLLTLVGPGGSGKTRLALEAAAAQLDNYAHGVFFVSLAPLQSVEAIVPTVAEALSFSFYTGAGGVMEGKPGQPFSAKQQLLDYLRQKTMIIIMDNFEHLLDGTVLVTDILETAPDVKILTTSRERLNVQGEHLFSVAGMAFPEREAPADALDYSAVKLFMQSAQRVRPDLELHGDDLRHVARICRLVEGIPLAVLLAAGWVEMLTPAEIATEIGRGVDFLETDLRDVPERQRSMRAVFDHSWNLLTGRERALMQALSVFRGGFTREAAQHVTGGSLRELRALVDKSLLQRMPMGRYELHELLRQYAAEKLETLGDADTARDTHSAYYAEFLHPRRADLRGRRQLRALDEIEADFENVRAAWNWALEQKNHTVAGRLLPALGYFCGYRRHPQEHKELFQRARERLAPGPSDEPHLVWGTALIGEFYARPQEVDRAQVETGLSIARKHGQRGLIATGLRVLGEMASNSSDYAEALSFYEQSLAISRDLDDSFDVAETLCKLAETYRLLGRPEEAIEFARQSLDLSREIGDNFWAARSLSNTGVIAFFTGNYSEAEGHLREANTIYREMGYRAGVADSNIVMSKLAHIRGDHNKGRALVEEALEIAMDIGNEHIAQSARRLLGEKVDEGPAEQEPVLVTDIPLTIDRFEVKGLLAVGGVSAVYLAHDPDSGRDVVLKVANPEALKRSEWLLKGFRQAAELTKLSQHPAFPKVYDYGETAEHVYMVVEYIEGKDLGAILDEQDGFLPERDVIGWAVQICDALTYMHNLRPAPIIYRDVKPTNVMVDHHGRVRLIEFLIAEPYRAGREQTPIGTEGYAAPEQYFAYSDGRSDIYALGVTLHHLLTRRDPRKGMPSQYPLPRSLNPAISEELEAVIMKAVEHHPEDRYQSTEEMKAALLACL